MQIAGNLRDRAANFRFQHGGIARRADFDQPGVTRVIRGLVRDLHCGAEFHRRDRLAQRIIARICGDSDDRHRFFALKRRTERKPSADRIHIRKEFCRHRFIDDGNERSAGAVLWADIAAGNNRNAQRSKIVGPDQLFIDMRAQRCFFGHSFNRKVAAPGVVVERAGVGNGRGADSRERFEPFDQCAVQSGRLFRSVSGLLRIDSSEHDVVFVEAGSLARQLLQRPQK